MKIAFYTAIFGDYTPVDIPRYFKKLENCDYFLFTNLKKELFQTSWKIINIEKKYSNILSAKNIKWNRHEILKNYDIIIWCDAYMNFNINNKKELFYYIENIDKYNIIINKHPERNCVYDELNTIVKNKKDSYYNIMKNRMILLDNNMPINYGLPETNFMIIDNKNIKLKKICSILFNFLLNNSYRDQACITYIFWKLNFKNYMFVNLKNIYEISGIHYVKKANTNSKYVNILIY